MKVKMNLGSTQIEADGTDTKDCFSQLANAAEVFSHSRCKACDSDNVIPVTREVDGNTYYEMRCLACGCTLSFGQTRQGGKLFPRRKDKSDNWLPNGGWVDFRNKAAANNEQPF
jgi:hypothetical protein